MSFIFGSKKKKKTEAEEKAEAGLPEPIIGKASAKAQAAHARRFGAAIPTVMGGGRSGFGETGPYYGVTRGLGLINVPAAAAGGARQAIPTPLAGVTAAPTAGPIAISGGRAVQSQYGRQMQLK